MKKTILTKDSEGNNLEINISNERHFSITGTAWEKGKRKTDQNIIYAGCCHEEILNVRPDLKLLVDLHLSDSLGQPMHALENGFYFYQIAVGVAKHHDKEEGDREKYTKILAEHLRISISQAEEIIENLDLLPENERKLEFASIVRSNLARWTEESIKGTELIESL